MHYRQHFLQMRFSYLEQLRSSYGAQMYRFTAVTNSTLKQLVTKQPNASRAYELMQQVAVDLAYMVRKSIISLLLCPALL